MRQILHQGELLLYPIAVGTGTTHPLPWLATFIFVTLKVPKEPQLITEVENATEATSFCLLFSFLKVFGNDLESFQKPDEALALFAVDELTNTDR